jgi:N12 class adenine-specific DNA methylase/predicted O-methyltransferase YrrM
MAELKPFSGEIDTPKDLAPFKGALDGEDVKTTAGDVIKSGAQGLAEGVGFPLQFAGNLVAQGVNRGARGLGLPDPELRAQNPLQGVVDYLETKKTPGGRRAVELSTPSGDLLDPSTYSLGEDPSVGGYLSNIARVAGQFGVPLGVGAAGKVLKLGERAIDIAGGISGAAQAGGAALDQEGRAIRDMDEAKLRTTSPKYMELLASGMDPATARERVAQDVELATGTIGAVPAALEGTLVQRLLRGKTLLPTVGKTAPTRIASAGVSGAVGEGIQEATEQVAQNIGARVGSGENRDLTEDTFGNALLGAAGGKIAGAGIQALHETRGKAEGGEEPSTSAKSAEARLFPFQSESAAAKRAYNKTEATGEEHAVIPHPQKEGRFAVVPKSDVEKFVPKVTDEQLARLHQQGRDDIAAMRDFTPPPPVPGDAEDRAERLRVADPSRIVAEVNATRGARARPLAPAEEGVVRRIAQGEFGDVQALTVDDLVEKGVKRGTAISLLDPTQKAMRGLDAKLLVDERAHEAATSPENELPEPTDAMKEAGNYQKGHLTLHGLDISIENPAGSKRRPEWPTLKSHYGYIRGSEGADGDHVDTFIGANPASEKVFVVDQVNPETGKFDEHKVMLGFDNLEAAREGYAENYTKGWKGLGAITETDVDSFKTWLKHDNTTKPFGTLPTKESANARAVENTAGPAAGAAPTPEADAGLGTQPATAAAQPEGVEGAAAQPEAPKAVEAKKVPRETLALARRTEQAFENAPKDIKDVVQRVGKSIGYALRKGASWESAETAERGLRTSGQANTAILFLREHLGIPKPGTDEETITSAETTGEGEEGPSAEEAAAFERIDAIDKKKHAVREGLKARDIHLGDRVTVAGRTGVLKDDPLGLGFELEDGALLTLNPNDVPNVEPAGGKVKRGPEGLPAGQKWAFPTMPAAKVFPEPKQTVSANKAAGEILPADEAKARLAEWKAEAKRMGREEDHSQEVVLSLFDVSGTWSQPYVDAGYDVRRYDIKSGDDLMRFMPSADIDEIKRSGKKVVGVLAATPCTSFAVSGARWWKSQHDVSDTSMVAKKYGLWATSYFETPLEYAKTLVHITEAIVELANPEEFHVLENPIGRIASVADLPRPLLTFDPANYGDPYTKRTQLWGDFNTALPSANVEATEGSFISKLRGDVEEDKARRSQTPEGFAYAFFMANRGKRTAPAQAVVESPVAAAETAPALELKPSEESKIKAVGGAENEAGPAAQDHRNRPARQGARQGARARAGGESQGLLGFEGGSSPAGDRGVGESARGGSAPEGRGVSRSSAIPDRSEEAGGGRRDRTRDRVLNYRIAPGELTRTGSWRDAAKRNLDIIELVKKLESEKRQATPEEQALLVKYTGWGASDLANNLFPDNLYQARPEWRELVERAQSLLTPEELKTAKRSTQYAHYTSEGVIRGIYKGLDRMGFTGGRVLEPGAGIGLFAGLMPEEMANASHYTGVEMDHLTAAIAKQLFPAENVVQGDFVKQRLPGDFFDAAIGNPPFARTIIQDDPAYKKYRFSLHDYFFAKTIDRVRPGGLLVFVTSRYTMDKGDDKARKYLAARADLLGAIRLPQTAFKQNAGTEVVTDVLFLKKREEGAEPAGEKWLGQGEVKAGETTHLINEYFVAHPEMVLGEHSTEGSMYRKDEYTVVPHEGAIEDQFTKAVEALPKGVYSVMKSGNREAIERATIERDFNPKVKKEGNLYVNDQGALMVVESGTGVALVTQVDKRLSAQEVKWLKGYVGIRDALKSALHDQLTDGDWQTSLKALQKAYGAFVQEHGPILDNTRYERKGEDDEGNETTLVYYRFKNDRLLKLDVEDALVRALERLTDDGGIVKGAFLLDRVVKKPTRPEIKTTYDAVGVALDERGKLDLDYVAQLIGKKRDQVIEDLGDLVYESPQGDWQMADEYLSGDVLAKLEEAEATAKVEPRFERNVQALIKVQPKPLGAADITVGLGSPWVPTEVLSGFAQEILGITASPRYNETAGQWIMQEGVSRGTRGMSEWGTPDRSASELFDAALNNRTVKVTREHKEDGRTTTTTDDDATAAANEKLKEIKDAFRRWVWTDAPRAESLSTLYNRKFNNLAPRKFDGSHLTLPGASLRFKLHPHQKRAIWRIVQTGDTYLAHAVGAGKTMEMIAAGMEMRRLGQVRRPLYTVPNHMLGQFSREFLELYPTANIMVADEENFHTANRRRFVARAALNDPDAIIITHSALGLIDAKEDSKREVLQEILDELQAAMDAEPDKRLRKRIEQRIEAVEQRFLGRTGSKKDQVISFEEMGVDFIFVDEAHEFRKLDFATNRTNVKGITPQGSMRAIDLFIKSRILRRQNNGRSLVMASGTPITNTMGELYTVMRFFTPDTMDADGIGAFDAWANQFGEVVPGFEQNAAGKYEIVERFSRFVNVPELMKRVRSFMDVLTSSQLGALVERPDIDGGGRKIEVVPATAALKSYQQTVLQPRIETARKWKPSRDEPFNPDPIINIITDGRLASIDMRFVHPGAKSDPNSKLNRMITKIIETHQRTTDWKYVDPATGKAEGVKGAAQIVFSNAGFGRQVAANRGFDARAWVMQRFKEAGIPASQVAWRDDYDTTAKKEALFKEMRSGGKRILMGSAKNMGTGLNVQRRLYALHYMDPPWFPSDLEQPEGRIIRQGNLHKNMGIPVQLTGYATKGSYDSTMWSMVARKARFIEQAFLGDDSVRKIEDVSESSQYELAAALAAGDERAIQLAGVRADVERLTRLEGAHHQEQSDLRGKKRTLETDLAHETKKLAALELAAKDAPYISASTFTGSVAAKPFEKRTEWGEALLASVKGAAETMTAKKGDAVEVTVGRIADKYLILVRGNEHFARVVLQIAPDLRYTLDEVSDVIQGKVDAGGLATRAINRVNGLSSQVYEATSKIDELTTNLKMVNKRLGAPFEFAQELGEKVAETARIEAELTREGGDAAQMAAMSDNMLQGLVDQWEDEGGRHVPEAPEEAAAETAKLSRAFRHRVNKDALPVFANEDIILGQPRLAQTQPIEKGLQRVVYDIVDTSTFKRWRDELGVERAMARAKVGETLLDVKDGKFKSLWNIEIYPSKRGEGHGREAIASMLLSQDEPILIRDIQDSAVDFWLKMGAKFPRSTDYMEANLDRFQYEAYQRGRGRGQGSEADRGNVAQGEEGARGEASPGAGESLDFTEPRFSRNRTKSRRGFDRLEAPPQAGLVTSEVRRAVAPLRANWENAPAIEVVATTADLPFPVSADAEGAFHNEKVYLVAANIADAHAAQRVVLHEVAGHYGLLGVLGKRLEPTMLSIYRTNPTVRALAAQWMASNPQTGGQTHEQYLALAAEEALADLAGTGLVREQGFWRWLSTVIRRALRSLGFTLDVNDAEIQSLLGQARRFVEGGSEVAAGKLQLAFSESRPVWYSDLARQLAAVKNESASPDQWKATIKNLKGVKGDEIEWSGILDWLATRQDKVTKAEVQQFLEENGVKVEETLLGEGALGTQSEARREMDHVRVELDALGYDLETDDFQNLALELVHRKTQERFAAPDHGELIDKDHGLKTFDDLPLGVQALIERYDAAAGVGRDDVGNPHPTSTRHEQYVLPGGENYRELLLTLPRTDSLAKREEIGLRMARVRKSAAPGVDYMRLPEYEALQREMREVSDVNKQEQPFRSSHFDQPNILAHVRFDERTDAEGKKVLFIEEIQSDWAQKGKRLGFRDAKAPSAEQVRDRLMKKYARGDDDDWVTVFRERATEEEREEYNTAQQIGERQVPPAAPFVGKTEAWVALAVKRMIRYAVEHGFDRVAYTTGEQQVERYELSKHIVALHVGRETDSTYSIGADTRNGVRDLGYHIKEADLPEYVGKDMADKIISNPKARQEYSGLDLKIGGEGMRAFYDKIVPNVVNDVLKKLGGGRVTTVDLSHPDLHGPFRVVPGPSGDVYIEASATAHEPAMYFAGTDNDWTESKGLAQPMFPDAARTRIAQLERLADSDRERFGKQQGFDITPELAARAMQGMPKFHRAYHGTPPVEIRAKESRGFDLSQVSPALQAKLSDILTTQRKFNWWHRTVGTQYHKAAVNREFKPVFEASQRFVQDVSLIATEAADLAPALLPKLESVLQTAKDFIDVKGTRSHQADVRAIAKAVFQGTLKDERVYTAAELFDDFKLSERQVALYKQFRKAVDRSLDMLAISEMSQLAQGYAVVDPSLAATVARAKEAPDPTAALGIFRQHLQDLARSQPVAYQKEIGATLNTLEQVVERVERLKVQGYAPLMRFGQHYVYFYKVNSKGERETQYFALHENERDANADYRRMKESFQDDTKVLSTHGLMSQDSYRLFKGVSPETLALFADALGVGEDAGKQAFLRLAVSQRSALKRMIHRKGIEGFSEDVGRTLASFITSNARLASKNYHMGEMKNAAESIRAGDVKDDAMGLVGYLEDPQEEAAKFRGFLFAQYLGGSAAAALVNATQPITMSFPYLTQFGKPADVARELGRGAKIALGKGAAADPDLAAAMKRAAEEGVTEPAEIHQLYAESIRGLGSNIYMRRFFRLWGSAFQLAEQFNRKTTFAAAYAIARARGAPDPYGFATKAVHETQGIYNKANRPNWARGPIGSTVFTFKQFSVSYLEFLSRLPRKQQALALAILMLAAGIQGLPFGEDLEDLIDSFAESLGYNFSTEKAMHDFIAESLGLGKGAADWVLYGSSTLPGMPLDVQARMGLGNLIPGTGLLRKSSGDKSREALEVFGPAGGLIKSGIDAFSAVQGGNFAGAAQKTTPVAVQNITKAADMAAQGYYRDDRGRRVVETDAADVATKAIGFQPADVAATQRAVGRTMQGITLARVTEGEIASLWAEGVFERDPDKIRHAKERLVDWNQKNPGTPIAIAPGQILRRVREMSIVKAQRIEKSAPKELRGEVARDLRR